MLRTALRNVLAHKLRLLMTMLAVVLGTAFVAGTLLFTATMDKGLQDSSARSFKDVSVAVQADGSGPMAAQGPGGGTQEKPHGVSEHTYRALKGLDGTASAVPVVSGFTGVADRSHNLIGNGWSNSGANFAPGADGKDSRYSFTSGRGPQNGTEIALDAKTAKDGRYHVGDTVDVSTDGPVRHQKLVGIFTTDDSTVSSGGTLTLFDAATAQKLFLAPGLYSEVQLKAASGTSQQQLLAEAKQASAEQHGLSFVTGKKLVDDQAKQISSQTSSMNTVFLGFAGIALFVGIFLIANTFTMLVAQRTRELALLRAVGASRRQVTRSVLIEAFVVGLVSAVVGFAAGIGIATGLRAVINSSSNSLPDNPLVISPSAIIAALAVGIGITVLSAWLPARRAAKIPPVAAMSSVDTPPKQRGLLIRNLIGALFVAVGAVGVAAGVKSTTAATLGGGAAALMVGVIVLTPLLSRPVMALGAPLLRLFGISGLLARKNAVRNPRRTAATAAALMIGLTLISALTVITTSLKGAVERSATGGLRADYSVSMANYRPLALSSVDEIKQVPGVKAASGSTGLDVRIDGRSTAISGSDMSVYGDLFSVKTLHGQVQGLKDGQLAVDDKTAKKRHWTVGSTVHLVYPDRKTQTATVAGIYRSTNFVPPITADQTMLRPHLFTPTAQQVFVKADSGASLNAVKKDIKKALGNSPIIQVQTKADLVDTFNKTIDQVLYMVYGLLGMSVVVAVIGVVNTMAMSVFERAREIGMLRAIGLERGRVKRMVRLESLSISVFGAILGLGMGTFLAWAAGRLVEPHFGAYALEMPWARYGLFFVLAIVVGVLAALWPARRAARLNALEAIKAD